eukprot:TRINITY_DN988_c0_g1_i1.p1 TRINITY_DN988_c0_g1~~TRINITY_DN988_c0_g1_i1.p1  ORF type:complete len:644 (-),score=138.57 TRINITY_DN988_c0_g1_i1:100-2031(-)
MASADVAHGHLETRIADIVDAKEREVEAEADAAMMHREENEDNIRFQLEQGTMTIREAQELRARRKMHEEQKAAQAQGGAVIKGTVLAGAEFQGTDAMIEETLSKKNQRHWIKDVIWKTFRIDQLNRHIENEKVLRAKSTYKHVFPWTHSLVTSVTFELVSFLVVVANGLLTGVQISLRGTPADHDLLELLEQAFTAVIMTEFVLRIMSDGWVWFFEAGNMIDLILMIGSGVIPSYILRPLFGIDLIEARILQALRCLRLLKLLKRVRTIPLFRILWSLIGGILNSGPLLMWMLLVMSIVIYMFAVLFIQLFKELASFNASQEELLLANFEDVPAAMFTLFQILTLDSWTGLRRPLSENNALVGFCFDTYACISTMIIMNLVIATIVNNAFKAAEEDEELQAVLMREQTEAELSALMEVFTEADTDGNGIISVEDYEEALDREASVRMKLKIVGLEEEEIEDLWIFMNFDEEVDPDTFCQDIRELKGHADAKTSFKIVSSIKKLHTRLEKARHSLELGEQFAKEIKREVDIVQNEMTASFTEVLHFVRYMHQCIPPRQLGMAPGKIEAFCNEMTKRVDPLLEPIVVPGQKKDRKTILREHLEFKKSEQAPAMLMDTPQAPRAGKRMSFITHLSDFALPGAVKD